MNKFLVAIISVTLLVAAQAIDCTAGTNTNCKACGTGTPPSTDCASCLDGFWLNGATCTACTAGCATCNALGGNQDKCLTCEAGYAQAATGAAPTTTARCVQCTAGNYAAKGDTACKACTNGFTDAKFTTCTPCATGCSTCTTAANTAATCTACVDGYYEVANAAATAANCAKCTTGCKTCDGTGLANCLTCDTDAGYTLVTPTPADGADVCTFGFRTGAGLVAIISAALLALLF